MSLTYPDGPALTVKATLKQPPLIARRLSDLTDSRFFADRLFMRGSPESVAGGSSRFQRAESKTVDRDAKKLGPRSEFPRAGDSTNVREAFVEDYGLEVPISGKAIRRNQIDVLRRGILKLANTIVTAVDNEAVSMFLADADIPTDVGADWATDGRAATDIAAAQRAIREAELGYVGDTLIVHEDQNADLMGDAELRASMPRESQVNPVMTGQVAPFHGLRQIIVTSNSALQGKAIVCNAQMVGTIADEATDPEEGYTTYTPPAAPGVAGGPSINVMVYQERESSSTIIRGARFPAMWIAEPQAAFILTGV